MNIENFYFTYGIEGHPFVGGWTKIEAPNLKVAREIFRVLHPDKYPGILNCSWQYNESEFRKTEMWSKGNFGAHEQEVVLMQYVNVTQVRCD